MTTILHWMAERTLDLSTYGCIPSLVMSVRYANCISHLASLFDCLAKLISILEGSRVLYYNTLKKNYINIVVIFPWKVLLTDVLEDLGQDKFWYYSQSALKVLSAKFNPFWKNVINMWASVKDKSKICLLHISSSFSIWLFRKIDFQSWGIESIIL
jgi:hypothetical protein